VAVQAIADGSSGGGHASQADGLVGTLQVGSDLSLVDTGASLVLSLFGIPTSQSLTSTLGGYINSIDTSTATDGELVLLTEYGSSIGLNQDALMNKINTCVTALNNTPTTDTNSLISISKSDAGGGSTLTFDYDNLVSRLNTYQAITAYNSSIANYSTTSQINTMLIPYVNTLTNNTVDANSYISLSKSNNTLTLNYSNLVTSSYYTSSQVDTKLIPYLNSLTNTTTDSDSLINLSKSNNILTLNYNNLVSRLNTYQTITAFNSSIALKADKSTTYTKTEVDSAIALSQSQIGTQITTTLIPYVNTLSVTTTDSNSLINLSKSNNTLTFNYDNLISRLSTYQTTTSYNSSIANYFTKTEINNTLGYYVNTVSNTTNDSLSLISLTKANNVLTFTMTTWRVNSEAIIRRLRSTLKNSDRR
jgi:hypothetical protein